MPVHTIMDCRFEVKFRNSNPKDFWKELSNLEVLYTNQKYAMMNDESKNYHVLQAVIYNVDEYDIEKITEDLMENLSIWYITAIVYEFHEWEQHRFEYHSEDYDFLEENRRS